MELKDRVAVITGGARIGQTVAEELARRGCHVALTFLNSKKSAEEALERVVGLGARGLVLKADLNEPSDAQQMLTRVADALGRLDILVNMAAIYRKSPVSALDANRWEEDIGANLRSAYLASLLAGPIMKRQGGGRIINFSDWVAASGRPRYHDLLPYYTAKMGVIGLTEALALELAPEVLVNAIAPGPILALPDIADEENQQVISATPLRRWGGSLEIAKAVIFLVETEFVTGECIRVDGGRHLH